MIKNAFYLRHDNNARNHPKLLEIRAEFGLIAYAMYFFLLEMLDESESGKINLRLLNGVALSMSVEKDILEKFVNYSVELGLFIKDEDNNIFSKRILEDKEYRTMLSEAGKKGAKIKKAKRDAKAPLKPDPNNSDEENSEPPSTLEAPLEPPLRQERRGEIGEKRKDKKEIKKEIPTFSMIYKKFPKSKLDEELKDKATWERMSDEDKIMAYELADIYLERNAEQPRRREYMPVLGYYLSQTRFNYMSGVTDKYREQRKAEKELAKRQTDGEYILKNPDEAKMVLKYIKENLPLVSAMKYQMNLVGADKLLYDYGYDKVMEKLMAMESWEPIKDKDSVVNVCRQWLAKGYGILVGGKDPKKVLEMQKIMSN